LPARFISSTTRSVGIITGEYKVAEAGSLVDRISENLVRERRETLSKHSGMLQST